MFRFHTLQKKMPIIQLEDKSPQMHESVFIAETASVIGNIQMDEGSSVWYGAVLRGDADHIHIGAGSNIQDNAVIHVDPGAPVDIGSNCTIGHAAIIHGARLSDSVLIGMGSTLLNHVEIGPNCIIGANSLLTQGKKFPEGSLITGSPAKVIRPLTDEEKAGIQTSANVYRSKSAHFKKFIKKLS
jgi:carbonic anhydrase/acetyltransferase-like protein (isoleucine patch superfamily)